MKVLFSSYACAPNCGSEPATGWNLAKGLSEKHDLTIMTRGNNRESIEASCEAWVKKATWCYLEPPSWLVFWKKGRRGVAPFYLIWQICAFFKARFLVKKEHFDLVHHVTFSSIVPASPLVFLGIPFVGGPLGGAEEPPPAFLSSLPLRLRLPFIFRRIFRGVVSRLFFTRTAYGNASLCLGATARATSRLAELGCREVKVTVQSGLSLEELTSFEKAAQSKRDSGSGPLRAVIASRLIYWKGVDIGIEAVAAARKRGVEVQVDILELGPELERLKKLARDLGVDDLISFRGRLPSHDDVFDLIASKDVLIHPALNESFGRVCIESMALGVPVICLEWGGPGMIVDDSCGYPIKVGRRDQMIEDFSSALEQCRKDQCESGFQSKRERARARARSFTWGAIVGSIDEAYQVVIKKT